MCQCDQNSIDYIDRCDLCNLQNDECDRNVRYDVSNQRSFKQVEYSEPRISS